MFEHRNHELSLAPAPTLLHWLRPARSRVAPCSFPCSPSPPRAAPAGASPLKVFSCGLRQPPPGRRFAVPQASCGTARAAMKPGSATKRVMAAACPAAMMWRLQAIKSLRGGSVSGAKTAYRGFGVRLSKCFRQNRL